MKFFSYIFFSHITLLFVCVSMQAQTGLSFCSGDSGDPIFEETFGTGTVNGPALPAGITNYNYVDGEPGDGDYTITSNINFFDWHRPDDHTEGDIDGRSLVVNADLAPNEFYRLEITGLCGNTTYEFSSWLINLHPVPSGCGTGLPINVKFSILDESDVELASGDTGDINVMNTPVWEQYALVFTTSPNQDSVTLVMSNNGVGGCGNDLAIDDIVFRTCGDSVIISDTDNETSLSACPNNAPLSITLLATPDLSVNTTHAYQWQSSNDGGVSWIDIIGANTEMLTTVPVSAATSYRVKVAQDPTNLSNELCVALSGAYELDFLNELESPVSDGDQARCPEQTSNIIVSVTVPADVVVDWYDSPVAGTLLAANSTSFETNAIGTFYAEAVSTTTGCISTTRTEVTITLLESPQVVDETVDICIGGTTSLDAAVLNATYLWSTGETTAQIVVNTAGTYTVEVTNMDMCSSTKTIHVIEASVPVIQGVISQEDDIIVSTTVIGNFTYSLDGVNFQDSNVFENIPGGVYTVSVRNDCGVDSVVHTHIVYPEYFTPNNDNIHDLWQIEGMFNFPSATVFIFDRHGKLLKQLSSTSLGWDGNYLGRQMPSSEYWFKSTIDGKEVKGHFSLIR